MISRFNIKYRRYSLNSLRRHYCGHFFLEYITFFRTRMLALRSHLKLRCFLVYWTNANTIKLLISANYVVFGLDMNGTM